MHLELTDEQRQLAKQGKPIDIVDATTNETYVLVAKQRIEQTPPSLMPDIPESIRISQITFRRDLPGLLAQKRLAGRWVAYHLEKQIGINRDPERLIQQCVKLGLTEFDFYLGWISPLALIEEPEIDSRLDNDGDGIDENP